MNVTNTKEFYEKNFDESTRLTGGDNRHLVEFERKKWLYSKMIDEYKPQVILQIACGTGVFTDWICETYPNIKVIATDLVDKHVSSLKEHDNLIQGFVWDCSGSLPNFDCKIDMVLVEGAWYHLNDRAQLIKNLNEIGASVIIIDWLSAWHDTTQQLLKNKKMPADYRNPRPDEPFVFDTEDDIDTLDELKEYLVRLFPVDMNTRFGYKDFNEVSAEEFYKYIAQLNMTIQLYGKEQTFIMNATEHGCYVLTKKNSLLAIKSL